MNFCKRFLKCFVLVAPCVILGMILIAGLSLLSIIYPLPTIAGLGLLAAVIYTLTFMKEK